MVLESEVKTSSTPLLSCLECGVKTSKTLLLSCLLGKLTPSCNRWLPMRATLSTNTELQHRPSKLIDIQKYEGASNALENRHASTQASALAVSMPSCRQGVSPGLHHIDCNFRIETLFQPHPQEETVGTLNNRKRLFGASS